MGVTYFGENSDGTTTDNWGVAYWWGAVWENTAGTGTLTELGINFSAGGTLSVRIGVYSDSSTQPGTLLLDAGEITNPTSGWNTISGLSLNVTNGTKYWLCQVGSATTPATRAVSATSGVAAYKNLISYGALPETIGTHTDYNIAPCMRAGVTVANNIVMNII